MLDYASVIVRTVFKLCLYYIFGMGILWVLYLMFAVGVGYTINSIHQANAPKNRVIEYIDCDKYYPMMRDQRCKPK